jgi:hypothetical protein
MEVLENSNLLTESCQSQVIDHILETFSFTIVNKTYNSLNTSGTGRISETDELGLPGR